MDDQHPTQHEPEPVEHDGHWYADGRYGFTPDQRICTDDARGRCLGTWD